ncbi:hypothetical protein [Dyadobacter luticola]|uniref:Leucine-rich repeat domain-containing protein n=1 Tax=Dyadobacter luticola TaxID=1979387 RepID=A0A5R9KX99_9BACT|nr:hypothetical protein [Dyadobacter luticola]TLV00791.1 hypothetical protein FEN17_15040 [Dyadobacter luticola]
MATGEGISGTIPPEIGNLTALKDLGFVGDEGPFVFHPPLGGKIPVELATLPNLENLTLVNNIFDQESVGLLFTMTQLKNLTDTPLSPLPDAIGNLVNLETLSLYGYYGGVLAKSENNGPIPKTIGI